MPLTINIIIILVGVLAFCLLILWFFFQKRNLEDSLSIVFKSKISQLNKQYEDKKKLCELEIEKLERDLEQFKNHTSDVLVQGAQIEDEINAKIAQKQQDFDAILRVLLADEKEKNLGLLIFNDNEKEDIQYIISEIAPKLHDKTIASKILWDSFFSDAAKKMFTLGEIDDTPGIYKITNLNNSKVYIGKSVKLKSRLIEHIKGALGYTSINDQLIHREMARDGIWNFKFEKLCSCATKDELNEQEKFFIKFFHAQEYGYNKTTGG